MTSGPLDDYPRTVVLKDGAHLVLRPMTAADRAGVAALELDVADATVIVAADGERVAGASLIQRRGDVGGVRVRLAPSYRDRRLGTWLLLDAVHLAGAFGVARLETHAASDDAAYRAALRRLDFVEHEPGVFVKTLHASWPDF